MNAPANLPSRAVLADALHRASAWQGERVPSFADSIRAEAKQIAADVAAGRKVVTEHGIFTPHDLACAVEIDGGIYWPTRSCGVVL